MKIAIIAAMEKEIDMFIEKYHTQKISNFHDVYEAKLENKILYFSLSGIGKVNSAMNTQYLIDVIHPTYVINTGCAGSLTDQVSIMDTVLSETVTYHDFSPIRIMQMSTPDNGSMKSDQHLLSLATDIVENMEQPYHIGSICSGDCFVTNDQMRDQIFIETNALCVDMESGSIAHVCRKNNIPFLAIRTISDFSDGAEEKEREAALISSKIVKKMIDKINE